jgi:hypothetical protein
MRDSPHFKIYKIRHSHEEEGEHHEEEEEAEAAKKFKMLHKYRECGAQGRNDGPLKTPEGCASVALENGCDNFMFSHTYPVWGCRCCTAENDGPTHKLWNVYTVDVDLARTKKDYYKLKAKVNAVKEIVEQGKDQVTKEELEVNTVTLEETDKEHIKEAINKYTNYKPSKNAKSFGTSSFTFSFETPVVTTTTETTTTEGGSSSTTTTSGSTTTTTTSSSTSTTTTTGGWTETSTTTTSGGWGSNSSSSTTTTGGWGSNTSTEITQPQPTTDPVAPIVEEVITYEPIIIEPIK